MTDMYKGLAYFRSHASGSKLLATVESRPRMSASVLTHWFITTGKLQVRNFEYLDLIDCKDFELGVRMKG